MKNKKAEKTESLKIENIIENNKKIVIKDKTFQRIMFIYSMAIKELKTKIEIIQDEFKILHNYELINNINTRIKTPESIIDKMKKKKYNLTYKEMIDKINDIAGIRIICNVKKDIFTIKEIINKIPRINIIKEKDYITHPKKSGYSSYHIILEIPIDLYRNNIYVKVEVQIRTVAMDFWANMEHKMKYKTNNNIDKKTSKELVNYAKIINKLDNKIILINNL